MKEGARIRVGYSAKSDFYRILPENLNSESLNLINVNSL
jgi:hypothetical protein